MGKGSKYRPVNQQRYDENYERIYGKSKYSSNEQSNTKANTPDVPRRKSK